MREMEQREYSVCKCVRERVRYRTKMFYFLDSTGIFQIGLLIRSLTKIIRIRKKIIRVLAKNDPNQNKKVPAPNKKIIQIRTENYPVL